jgi:hypothetical protein
MGVSECSIGVPPAKSGSSGHKTMVLHRRDARATLFCRRLYCFATVSFFGSRFFAIFSMIGFMASV